MSNNMKRSGSKKKTGPGMGVKGTPKARIVMRMNPRTGQMQEYHMTKGWR